MAGCPVAKAELDEYARKMIEQRDLGDEHYEEMGKGDVL